MLNHQLSFFKLHLVSLMASHPLKFCMQFLFPLATPMTYPHDHFFYVTLPNLNVIQCGNPIRQDILI
jgi:hypothetical protein